MKHLLLLCCTFFLAVNAYAVGAPVSAEKQAILTAEFLKARPDFQVKEVLETPVQGMYEVRLVQGLTLYMFEGGEYFVAGDLFQLQNAQIKNYTDTGRNVKRKALMATMDPSELIIFPAENEKAVVNVFTDVDCFYCQKLHKDIQGYNDLGITVRYLAYPRAGIGSPSYKKIAAAWCADDRQEALTRLKQGKSIPIITCKNNPVSKQYMLGDSMGVTGTPAIFLKDGTMLPGYRPPAELAQALGLKP